MGYNEKRVIFDPTLVRGMSYYTGPVFEVESKQTYKDEKGNDKKVGSICGGGRYDDLVEKLLGIKVPATGASIGVDRLAELLQLTKQASRQISGPVLVVVFDDNLMPEYQKIASQLRKAKIDAEVYYGYQRGINKQLAYADKKNCPIAILLGEDELKKELSQLKI
ncbi:MAG: ATP phosphoribosyltransferase regulatory subunit [Lewinellaceae bacterium]|nr:ATP phosphoribosyltransferase regulatory subunit [Lewinellaceae bacterium]